MGTLGSTHTDSGGLQGAPWAPPPRPLKSRRAPCRPAEGGGAEAVLPPGCGAAGHVSPTCSPWRPARPSTGQQHGGKTGEAPPHHPTSPSPRLPISPSSHLPIFPSPHHPISPSPQPSLPLLSPRGVHAASPSCGPPPGDQRRANYCFLFSRPCGSARRGSPSVRPTILCGDLEVAQARISVSLVTAGPSTGHIRPPRRSNASAAHLCFRFQVREQGGRVFHGTPNRRL